MSLDDIEIDEKVNEVSNKEESYTLPDVLIASIILVLLEMFNAHHHHDNDNDM